MRDVFWARSLIGLDNSIYIISKRHTETEIVSSLAEGVNLILKKEQELVWIEQRVSFYDLSAKERYDDLS